MRQNLQQNFTGMRIMQRKTSVRLLLSDRDFSVTTIKYNDNKEKINLATFYFYFFIYFLLNISYIFNLNFCCCFIWLLINCP